MAINGVRKLGDNRFSIYYIDNFSDEFKEIIRSQLKGVWNGFAQAETIPTYYSYESTLKSFLDRYNGKDEDTRKGMIGELLTHMILNHEDNSLRTLSILKNKEERSIKKGFDVIYHHTVNNNLWYTEVKSGRSATQSSTDYNNVLLKRSKDGIYAMIQENRESLWESALIDVTQAINLNDGRQLLLELLSQDAPSQNADQRKNVILVSSLYHALGDEIALQSVEDFLNSTIAEGIFLNVIVVSIQKTAFETVANFLTEEAS